MYRRAAVQHVRGVGLGITDAEVNAKYPWHKFSQDTVELQKATNSSLKQAGYCPIPVSGMVDGSLCGARNHLTIHSRELFGRDMLFDSPTSCDDPAHADELSMPTFGCYKPSAFNPEEQQSGLTREHWILIGGALSAVIAVAVAIKGK